MPDGGDVFCWNRGCFLLEPACVFAAFGKPMVFWFLAEIFLRGGMVVRADDDDKRKR